MIISVASGKGGTGKTTVAVNLALSLGKVSFIDCDVEEPNAHLFLKPRNIVREPVSIKIPEINKELCDYCGKCVQVCAYNAVAIIPNVTVLVFEHLCHGCGACSLFCPRKAITETAKEVGYIERGVCGDIEFCSGTLKVGETMTVPVIKSALKNLSVKKTTIIDAPPGTACPFVASVHKSDFCLLVTEPTPFGLNDMKLAIDVLNELQHPFGVVVNRYDLGDDCVESYCRKLNIPVLMRLPFDREIARVSGRGEAFIYTKKEYIDQFKQMFLRIEDILKSDSRARKK